MTALMTCSIRTVTLSLTASALLLFASIRGVEADSCKRESFPSHNVYNATLLYYIDETYPLNPDVSPPFFRRMDPDQDTQARREKAYGFFRDRYGLNFNPDIAGDQEIYDENGGTARVQALFTAPVNYDTTHQVYAMDAQSIPQLRGKFPLTDLAIKDDGYFVTFVTDFTVYGEYGGASGAVVSAESQIVTGQYNVINGKGEPVDSIRYFADQPVYGVPLTGNLDTSLGAQFVIINCRVESDLFGTGSTRSLSEVRPLFVDGLVHFKIDWRYIMRFPVESTGTTFCDNVN